MWADLVWDGLAGADLLCLAMVYKYEFGGWIEAR